MRWIVSRSLRFRWLVLFAAAAMMAFGIAQIPSTKVDVFPEFAPPRVEIQTIALGNSSTEVEQLITVPIEEQLNGLPGLDELRSKSVAQLSSIQLIFERGTDEMRARQLVQERIAQVTPTLPTWASPPWMMPPLSATSRIMKIGLSSDDLNLVEMSSVSYWKIRQRLLRVSGVAAVDIYGERLQQRHVQVDPAKLAENGVSLERVMETSANAVDAGVLAYTESFAPGTGGFVEAGGQRMNVRHVQPIVGPEQLGEVPVVNRSGRVLRLSDLGTVREAHQPVWGAGVVNEGDGLLLIVQKFRGANTMEVTEGVEQAVDELRPGLPGIEIDTTIFRPATFIEQSIDNLTTGVADRRAARDLHHRRVPVRVAHGVHQPDRHPAVADRGDPGARPGRQEHQRDGPGRPGGRHRGGGGRRDHRRGEHRATPAAGTRGGQRHLHVPRRARRLGRGAQRDHLRDRHQRRGDRPCLLPGGPVGFVLPAARALLRAGGAGVDAGRADSHAGALPAPPLEGTTAAARVPVAARAEARIRGDPRTGDPPAQSGDRDGGRLHARRAPDLSDARLAAAAQLQGAGLPDALAHRAGHRRVGGDTHLGEGLPRPARDPWCPKLRLPHRAGADVGRDLRRLLRRELDQRQRGRRLRQDARRRPQDGRGLSRPLSRRADLPEGTDQGSADGDERVDRRAHLRPRPARPSREG